MNDYLIDRETLGEFVDELIKKQALAVDDTDELNRKREEAIKALDDKIGVAVFGQFTQEQYREFDQMLDRDETTKEDYQAFFDKIGLNLEETITNAMQEFAQEFLGGKNA